MIKVNPGARLCDVLLKLPQYVFWNQLQILITSPQVVNPILCLYQGYPEQKPINRPPHSGTVCHCSSRNVVRAVIFSIGLDQEKNHSNPY
jgi:hypothetical protein